MERDEFLAAASKPGAWVGPAPMPRRSMWSGRAWATFLAILTIVIVVLASVGAGTVARWWDHRSGSAQAAQPVVDTSNPWAVVSAEVDPATLRVVDGDTMVVGTERVRILNLDAPEMPGRARCDRESQLALAAKDKLTALLAAGGLIVYLPDQKRPLDRYGRTLARVTVGGEDVAGPMIAAGVARPWRGRSSDWCGV